MEILVHYTGDYPNLCSGLLSIAIEEVVNGVEVLVDYEFPSHCMSSGGSVSFDNDWNEDVQSGPWDITEWPKGSNFTEAQKQAIIDAVNEHVPYGCCGGCV